MFIILYDYKSDDVIQDVIVENAELIAEDIVDEYSTLRRDDSISIYAPVKVAINILGEFLDMVEDVWVHEESENELLKDDKNEVLVTLGNDGMIFVEEARGDKNIAKMADHALAYVYDSFSNKDVEQITRYGCSTLVFGFEEDDECDGDCENCELHDSEITEDEETRFTTFHKSEAFGDGYSSISFSSTDPDLVKEFAKFYR